VWCGAVRWWEGARKLLRVGLERLRHGRPIAEGHVFVVDFCRGAVWPGGLAHELLGEGQVVFVRSEMIGVVVWVTRRDRAHPPFGVATECDVDDALIVDRMDDRLAHRPVRERIRV